MGIVVLVCFHDISNTYRASDSSYMLDHAARYKFHVCMYVCMYVCIPVISRVDEHCATGKLSFSKAKSTAV